MILFFIIGLFEVVAEYFNEILMMYILKPLLMPIMMLMYWKVSSKRNIYFLLALFFVLIANILFVSKNFNSAIIASIFFFIYRGIVIYLVIQDEPIQKKLPVVVGTLPFFTAFAYLTFLTKNELGKGIYIYLIQVLFLSFLGGLALSNYMIKGCKKNFWLLINAVFFAIIQFVLVLKLFYVSIAIFSSISMFLYLFAQFALYRYMLEREKEISNFEDCDSFLIEDIE
ncbi:hypothetical protein HUE46_13280 [Flavobacterium columnare]|uniref:lysoplasmalogenase family protein n=1 Tax=Flavobacterium columnare TaxID=996 RepID=UPI0013F62B24|nr:lysoplasmalogenase family protein [Flavobacterium columnare]QOG93552.1 hypothetical protein HUE42_13275 [Flavobacterium columnare]QOG98878.1 hypothetical protein HUE44_13275 [Flavobacterium columnare]QOH01537.1 hypothetical protein HUE45_13275 [Flavobacterium columnare]QOH04198.1 hypothetical protein HUE46_13280 [Flavobacterium columnare]QOH14826.1 hypothetical protein HUE50_13280 [Flavobacterium columnare]